MKNPIHLKLGIVNKKSLRRTLSVLLAFCVVLSSVAVLSSFLEAFATSKPDVIAAELYPTVLIEQVNSSGSPEAYSYANGALNTRVGVRSTDERYNIRVVSITAEIPSLYHSWSVKAANPVRTNNPIAGYSATAQYLTSFTVSQNINSGINDVIRYWLTYDVISRSNGQVVNDPNGTPLMGLETIGYGYVSSYSAWQGVGGATVSNLTPGGSGQRYNSGWTMYQYCLDTVYSSGYVITKTNEEGDGGALTLNASGGTTNANGKVSGFTLVNRSITWAASSGWGWWYDSPTNNIGTVFEFRQPADSGYWSFNVSFNSNNFAVETAWRLASDESAAKNRCDSFTGKCLQRSYYEPSTWNAYISALDKAQATFRIPKGVTWLYFNACNDITDLVENPVSGALQRAFLGLTYKKYTLSYNVNGGTILNPSQMASQEHEINSRVILKNSVIDAQNPANHTFMRTGYSFVGWSTNASAYYTDPGEPQYRGGDPILINKNLTLYALWRPVEHTVTYYSNYTGQAVTNEPNVTQKVLTGATWVSEGRPSAWSKDGYRFNGWYSDRAGQSYVFGLYADQDAWPASQGDMEIFAYWSPGTYFVRYASNDNGNTVRYVNNDPNNGGAPYTETPNSGTAYTYFVQEFGCNDLNKHLANNRFVKEGYNFIGWSTNPVAVTAMYTENDSATLSQVDGSTVTVYPVWQAKTYTLVFQYSGAVLPTDHTLHSGYVLPTTAVITYGRSLFQADYYDANGDPIYIWQSGVTDVNQTAWPTAAYMHELGLTLVPQTSFSHWGDVHPNNGVGNSIAAGDLVTSAMNIVSSSFTRPGTEGSVLIYAHWGASAFLVTFDYNGGVGSEIGRNITQGQQYNATGPLPVPTRTGYEFGGWYRSLAFLSADLVVGTSVKQTAGAETLYAKWNSTSIYVEFEPNGADSGYTKNSMWQAYRNDPNYSNLAWSYFGSGSEQTYVIRLAVDQTFTLPPNVYVRSGYVFEGWEVTVTATGETFMLSDNESFDSKESLERLYACAQNSNGNQLVTLRAAWTSNTYLLTFDTRGGALFAGNEVFPANEYTKYVLFGQEYQSIPYSTSTYWPDASEAPDADPAPTRANYVFAGWYTQPEGGTVVTATTLVSISGNHTVYAHWSPANYTITFSANGGNFVFSPYREAYTLRANSSDSVPAGSFVIDGGVPYQTQFRDISIVEPSSGATQYLWLTTGIERIGYSFTGWFLRADGAGTALSPTALVTARYNGQVLYAGWRPNVYNITFDYDDGFDENINAILPADLPFDGTITIGAAFGDADSGANGYISRSGYYTLWPDADFFDNLDNAVSNETYFVSEGNQRYCAHIHNLIDNTEFIEEGGQMVEVLNVSYYCPWALSGTMQSFPTVHCRGGDGTEGNPLLTHTFRCSDLGQIHDPEGARPEECVIIATPHEYTYFDEAENDLVTKTVYTYQMEGCECCEVTFNSATGTGSCAVAYLTNLVNPGYNIVGWQAYINGTTLYTDGNGNGVVFQAEDEIPYFGVDGTNVTMVALWESNDDTPYRVEHRVLTTLGGTFTTQNPTLAQIEAQGIERFEIESVTVGVDNIKLANGSVRTITGVSNQVALNGLEYYPTAATQGYMVADGSLVFQNYYKKFDYIIAMNIHDLNYFAYKANKGATYAEMVGTPYIRSLVNGDMGFPLHSNVKAASMMSTPRTHQYKFSVWEGYSMTWWTKNGWTTNNALAPVVADKSYGQIEGDAAWGVQIKENDYIPLDLGTSKYNANVNNLSGANQTLYGRWMPDHVEVTDAGIMAGKEYDYLTSVANVSAEAYSYETITAVYELHNSSNKGGHKETIHTAANTSDIRITNLTNGANPATPVTSTTTAYVYAPTALTLASGVSFSAGTKIKMIALHNYADILASAEENGYAYEGSAVDEDGTVTVYDYTLAADTAAVYVSDIVKNNTNSTANNTHDLVIYDVNADDDYTMRLIFYITPPSTQQTIEQTDLVLTSTTPRRANAYSSDNTTPVVSSSNDILYEDMEGNVLKEGSPSVAFTKQSYSFGANDDYGNPLPAINVVYSGDSYIVQTYFSGTVSERQSLNAVLYLEKYVQIGGVWQWIDDSYYAVTESGNNTTLSNLEANVRYRLRAELYLNNIVNYDTFPRGGYLVAEIDPAVDPDACPVFMWVSTTELDFSVELSEEITANDRIIAPGGSLSFDVTIPYYDEDEDGVNDYSVVASMQYKDEGSGDYLPYADATAFTLTTGEWSAPTNDAVSTTVDLVTTNMLQTGSIGVGGRSYRTVFTLKNTLGNELAKFHVSFIALDPMAG